MTHPLALVFDTVPVDAEALKEKLPERSGVEGGAVYLANVVRALLRLTECELIFLNSGPPAAQTIVKDEHVRDIAANRIRFVRPGELGRFELPARTVFFAGGTDMARFVALRRYLRQPGAPIVGITHSLNGYTLPLTLMLWWLEVGGPQDALICTTTAARSVVRAYMARLEDRLRVRHDIAMQYRVELPVIPLGIDVDAFDTITRDEARQRLSIPMDRVVVLYVGRFSTLSKADLRPLVLAFADAQKRWQAKATLILAGDDSGHRLRGSLEAFGRSVGCGDTLVIKPNLSREDKRSLLAAADVFVSPSDHVQETFGITVAEAMAAGLPVIASDWDGYRDTVVHGETGLLVPTCTVGGGPEVDMYGSIAPTFAERLLAQTTVVDPAYLIRALTDLVEHPELRRRFGEEARRVARARLDWRVVISQYERLWCDLLDVSRTHTASCAAAAASDASPPFPLRQTFASYPTSTLEDSDAFELSESASERWHDLDVDAIFRDDGILSNETLRRVMTELERSPRDVKGLANQLAISPADASLHVARLWKFGFLTRTGGGA
jgi:D-inositol-3-phosphate glycosyltransferase